MSQNTFKVKGRTSYSKTLSRAKPYLLEKGDVPPPRVNPPTPTPPTRPPTKERPWESRSRYTFAVVAPPPMRAVLPFVETSTVFMRSRSIVTPATEFESSRCLEWPPPLTAKLHQCSTRIFRTRDTSLALEVSTRQAGRTSFCLASQMVKF